MPPNKLLRVTQINAVYFDREILKIFKEQVSNILRYLPPGILSRYQPEVDVTIKLAILYYSIIKSDRTFGQKLLSLQYAHINTKKKVLCTLGLVFEYAHERLLELFQCDHHFYKTLSVINGLLTLARFINLTVFLRTGKYPTLRERLLGLEHEYTDNGMQRYYSSKYLTRELLWNGLIEILVYVLPLINQQKVKRLIRQINPFYKKGSNAAVSNPSMNRHTKCAYCSFSPVKPHHMGCEHIFCYVCLKSNQMADEQFECPVCGVSRNICKIVNAVY